MLLRGFCAVADIMLYSMSSRFRLMNVGDNSASTLTVDVGVGLPVFMGGLNSLLTEYGFVVTRCERGNMSI